MRNALDKFESVKRSRPLDLIVVLIVVLMSARERILIYFRAKQSHNRSILFEPSEAKPARVRVRPLQTSRPRIVVIQMLINGWGAKLDRTLGLGRSVGVPRYTIIHKST